MKRVHIKSSLINRLLIVSFLIIVCPALSLGQIINLVPDPSFEDTIITNQSYFTPHNLRFWQSLDSTNIMAARSTYMSYTAPIPVVRLPSNQWFYQHPRSGGGVVELENTFYSFYSEYKRSLVKCRLKQKLVAGKTYYAKLYCVSGERYYSHFADGISMYFDNGQLDTMVSIQHNSTGIYPQVIPQVINPYGNIITDTVNWTKIEGCFVANGTESHLTIGNFKNDANTARTINPAGFQGDTASGMLIDDITVYPIDLANWLPPTYGYLDTAIIGLPNYEIPDAKWYTYDMQLIDSGSQIKVVPPASGTKYICGIDLCNTMVFDTVEVVQWPLAINNAQIAINNLRVYPNPTEGGFKIGSSSTEKQDLLVELYDMTGKKVFAENCTFTGQDCQFYANVTNGLYLIRITNITTNESSLHKIQFNK